jgi:hypothetical protein
MSGDDQAVNNANSCKFSRRQTLKTIGISSTAVTTTPALVGATKNGKNEETIQITTVRAGAEPRVQKEVPLDWWSHEQKADRVRLELNKQYKDIRGIQGVSLGTSEETLSGRKKSVLDVRVDSEGYNTTIPERVEAIKLNTEVAVEPEPNYSCSDDTDAHSYVSGGVSLTDDAAIDAKMTSTCEVEFSGTHYLMTCAHNWPCDTSAEGDQVFQADQKVGEVYREKKNQDWVIIEMISDSDISGFSHYIENDTDPLCGHVTRDGLIDLKGAGTTVYQQGITTCKSKRTVMDVDCSYTGCYWNDGHTVRIDEDPDGEAKNGDSGGPIFHNYYYDGSYFNALICPHSGTDPENSACFGTAAYWIHSDQLIDFNPHGCSNMYS